MPKATFHASVWSCRRNCGRFLTRLFPLWVGSRKMLLPAEYVMASRIIDYYLQGTSWPRLKISQSSSKALKWRFLLAVNLLDITELIIKFKSNLRDGRLERSQDFPSLPFPSLLPKDHLIIKQNVIICLYIWEIEVVPLALILTFPNFNCLLFILNITFLCFFICWTYNFMSKKDSFNCYEWGISRALKPNRTVGWSI